MNGEIALETDEEEPKEVIAATKPGYCQLPGCGSRLSVYNKTGFCHSRHRLEEIEEFKVRRRKSAKSIGRCDLAVEELVEIVKRVVKEDPTCMMLCCYLAHVDLGLTQDEAATRVGYSNGSSAYKSISRFKKRLTLDYVVQEQVLEIRKLYPPPTASS